MRKKLDFMKVSKDLNTLKDAHKEYSSKEISELMTLAGLPTSSQFRKNLINNKILEVINRDKNGVFYKFIADSVFYLNIEAAYRQYRKERNSYIHKLNKKSVTTEEVAVVAPNESAIQAAIALLKSQGDRFKITEKIVTVEFKDL